MKAFYLTLSIVFTTLILVLAFENLNALCSNLNFFAYNTGQNPTIIILAIAVIGMFTGACYHAFITRVMASGDDSADESSTDNTPSI